MKGKTNDAAGAPPPYSANKANSATSIVIVEPNGLIGFKLKGLRRVEWLPADVCYEVAVKTRIRNEAKEKQRRRKQK